MTFGDIIQKSIEAYNKSLELKNPKLLTKTKQEKMKTLQIEIPKGFVVDKFDTKNGIVSFKEEPKDIKEVIKTFSDVLNHLEIDKYHFNELNENLQEDEIAYRQIKLIVKALNEGWVPDWTNSNEYKYFPWWNMGSSSGVGFSYYVCGNWLTASHVGSRLVSETREKARAIGNSEEYQDLFKTMMVYDRPVTIE